MPDNENHADRCPSGEMETDDEKTESLYSDRDSQQSDQQQPPDLLMESHSCDTESIKSQDLLAQETNKGSSQENTGIGSKTASFSANIHSGAPSEETTGSQSHKNSPSRSKHYRRSSQLSHSGKHAPLLIRQSGSGFSLPVISAAMPVTSPSCLNDDSLCQLAASVTAAAKLRRKVTSERRSSDPRDQRQPALHRPSKSQSVEPPAQTSKQSDDKCEGKSREKSRSVGQHGLRKRALSAEMVQTLDKLADILLTECKTESSAGDSPVKSPSSDATSECVVDENKSQSCSESKGEVSCDSRDGDSKPTSAPSETNTDKDSAFPFDDGVVAGSVSNSTSNTTSSTVSTISTQSTTSASASTADLGSDKPPKLKASVPPPLPLAALSNETGSDNDGFKETSPVDGESQRPERDRESLSSTTSVAIATTSKLTGKGEVGDGAALSTVRRRKRKWRRTYDPMSTAAAAKRRRSKKILEMQEKAQLTAISAPEEAPPDLTTEEPPESCPVLTSEQPTPQRVKARRGPKKKTPLSPKGTWSANVPTKPASGPDGVNDEGQHPWQQQLPPQRKRRRRRLGISHFGYANEAIDEPYAADHTEEGTIRLHLPELPPAADAADSSAKSESRQASGNLQSPPGLSPPAPLPSEPVKRKRGRPPKCRPPPLTPMTPMGTQMDVETRKGDDDSAPIFIVEKPSNQAVRPLPPRKRYVEAAMREAMLAAEVAESVTPKRRGRRKGGKVSSEVATHSDQSSSSEKLPTSAKKPSKSTTVSPGDVSPSNSYKGQHHQNMSLSALSPRASNLPAKERFLQEYSNTQCPTTWRRTLENLMKSLRHAYIAKSTDFDERSISSILEAPLADRYPEYYYAVTEAYSLSSVERQTRANAKNALNSIWEVDYGLLRTFANARWYAGSGTSLAKMADELESEYKRLKTECTTLSWPESDHARWVDSNLTAIDLDPRSSPYRGATREAELLRCICGNPLDDIDYGCVQCDYCYAWQHVYCVIQQQQHNQRDAGAARDSNDPSDARVHPKTPESYVCEVCRPRPLRRELSCMMLKKDAHADCQYFYTLVWAGRMYRLGEFVYVPKEEDYAYFDIVCIDRLWINEKGEKRLYGHFYLRPYETRHESTRRFYPNELLRWSCCQEYSLAVVLGKCVVLDPRIYFRGWRHRRYSESDHYVCEYRVNQARTTFSKIRDEWALVAGNVNSTDVDSSDSGGSSVTANVWGARRIPHFYMEPRMAPDHSPFQQPKRELTAELTQTHGVWNATTARLRCPSTTVSPEVIMRQTGKGGRKPLKSVGKKVVRPKKKLLPKLLKAKVESSGFQVPVKRSVGRPRKNPLAVVHPAPVKAKPLPIKKRVLKAVQKPKSTGRPRGRPRKNPLPPVCSTQVKEEAAATASSPPPEKASPKVEEREKEARHMCPADSTEEGDDRSRELQRRYRLRNRYMRSLATSSEATRAVEALTSSPTQMLKVTWNSADCERKEAECHSENDSLDSTEDLLCENFVARLDNDDDEDKESKIEAATDKDEEEATDDVESEENDPREEAVVRYYAHARAVRIGEPAFEEVGQIDLNSDISDSEDDDKASDDTDYEELEVTRWDMPVVLQKSFSLPKIATVNAALALSQRLVTKEDNGVSRASSSKNQADLHLQTTKHKSEVYECDSSSSPPHQSLVENSNRHDSPPIGSVTVPRVTADSTTTDQRVAIRALVEYSSSSDEEVNDSKDVNKAKKFVKQSNSGIPSSEKSKAADGGTEKSTMREEDQSSTKTKGADTQETTAENGAVTEIEQAPSPGKTQNRTNCLETEASCDEESHKSECDGKS